MPAGAMPSGRGGGTRHRGGHKHHEAQSRAMAWVAAWAVTRVAKAWRETAWEKTDWQWRPARRGGCWRWRGGQWREGRRSKRRE